MSTAAQPASPARNAFWPAFAALLGGAMAMGISPIFVRLSDVGPFASAFYRVFLALPVLYAWMRLEERQAGTPDTGPAFSLPVIATALAFAADLFFWHLAIAKTTVANATFFATTAPVWVVIFGWLFFRRKASRGALVGLSLCLLGGLALVGQSFAFAPGHLIGDGFAEATAVFFGLYFLAVEKARLRHRAARLTFSMSVLTAAILALVALWATYSLGQRFLPSSALGWLTLFALAWVSHAGGQGLLSVALGSLPVVFSSLVIFLEAVAAAALGWLILGEAVSPLQTLGGLVIIAGIWIARPRTA
ncbi:membrane protein [Labrys miyagiensis]|uniref:Membrane protein n=1 Tax=Labrys miyagiensis TaxID=346912 RepID=A0ABQ6CCE4_9HYPH|nr:DMT family transporter [Labrys miyagiensis]GLS17348.1 membrane protein [Labrys miyagiensis]